MLGIKRVKLELYLIYYPVLPDHTTRKDMPSFGIKVVMPAQNTKSCEDSGRPPSPSLP